MCFRYGTGIRGTIEVTVQCPTVLYTVLEYVGNFFDLMYYFVNSIQSWDDCFFVVNNSYNILDIPELSNYKIKKLPLQFKRDDFSVAIRQRIT